MKKYRFLLFCLLVIVSVSVSAQTLPSNRKIGMPKYISQPMANPDGKNPNESWQDWCEKKILSGDLGDLGDIINTPWDVYSDRDNNKTYTSPGGNTIHSTLSFGEKLWVADYYDGYLLVYADKDKQKQQSSVISSSAECKGWIHIKNLLLWKTCPMNSNSIYEKGLVVHDPSKSQFDSNPTYLLAPANGAPKSGYKASSLDIKFVLKKVSLGRGVVYYLLSDNFSIGNTPFDVAVKGWLPNSYITEWNQRLAMEPTYASIAVSQYKGAGVYPCVYDAHSSALIFKQSGSAPDDPFWQYTKNFSAQRMDSYLMRFPILGDRKDNSHIDDNIYKVASIASLEGEDGSNTYAREIEELKQKVSNINVILVIDATASMKNYYSKIVEVLQTAIKRDYTHSIRVGAVLYKDYIDHQKNGGKPSFIPVTHRIEDVATFITNAKYQLGSADVDHWEAVFEGLDLALDSRIMGYDKQHSNFIILIGDAANHRDKKGPWREMSSTLSQKMFENNVNFLAFQVNHPAMDAYDFYPAQITYIANELMEKYRHKLGQPMEMELKPNNMKRLIREGAKYTDVPIMIQYIYSSQGESETPNRLRAMIEENIDEFQELIEENIKTLSGNIFGSSLSSSTGLQKEKLRAILRQFDWSDSKINKYLDHLSRGGITKIVGYTADRVDGMSYNLMDYSVLFAEEEVEILIRALNQVYARGNSRKNFQDAIIAMGKALLGEFDSNNGDDLEIDELMGKIFGIPVPINSCGFKIADILSMSDSEFNNYFEDFKAKCKTFETLKNQSEIKSGRFQCNGNTFYWVPFRDIPGFCQ